MSGRILGRLGLAALAAAVVGLTPAVANAGFTITLNSVSGAGPYTFDYSATITSGEQIKSGDFFRIYDFFGYIPGSIAAPAGWTVTTELVTPTPPPNVILTLGDDAAVPNLIFTYTGATPINGATSISGFMADSMFDYLGVLKNFAGRSSQPSGAGSDPIDAVGRVRVPGIVPEPASVLSTGLGGIILLAGLAARRRRANAR